MLITNNLSVYKTPYTFFKVFTSLVINDLSVYTLYTVLVAIYCNHFIINSLICKVSVLKNFIIVRKYGFCDGGR
jgi:hypothetical protein